jgi:hypothetical protein
MGPDPGQDQFGGPYGRVDPYRDVLPFGADDGRYPRPGGRGPSQRGRIIVVAAVVVAIAVAGGAFALVRHHNQAQAGSQPTGTASAAAAQSAPSAQGTAAPASTPASSGPASTPVSSGPASSPPVSPTAGSGGVAVAPGVLGNTAEPQVVALLNGYFTAINQHDYTAYASLLDQQERQNITASAFDSGFGTTTDSDETLTGISAEGSGEVAAMVTFTSHQQPSDSIDNSACTSWAITLFLVPNGTGGYLIGAAPSSYHASYQAC